MGRRPPPARSGAGGLGLTGSRLKIFFDGGCRPNPGAMETAVVARGQVHIARDLGHGTNNDAEWLALIAALRLAHALGARDVALLGDATLVVNQATGLWKCRGPGLQAHLHAFRALAEHGPAPHIRYIKRSQNLAGIALDHARFSASGTP